MHLENITLNKRSQTLKVTYYMIQFTEMFRVGKSIERASRLVISRAAGRKKWGFWAYWMVSFWSDENFLDLDKADASPTLSYDILNGLFKMVNFMM